jgi:hypothetical protein
MGCSGKRFLSLKDRLALYANGIRESAARLPPGTGQESLLNKARQAESASRPDDWFNSPDAASVFRVQE